MKHKFTITKVAKDWQDFRTQYLVCEVCCRSNMFDPTGDCPGKQVKEEGTQREIRFEPPHRPILFVSDWRQMKEGCD